MLDLKQLESEGIRIGNEKLVQLTESASDKLTELIQRENEADFLRIKITGGGCNGLSYNMSFSNKTKSGDILVHSLEGFVVIDSKTALFIKGTTLDYSHALVGGVFKFDNPNAKSSCSCGESFII